MQKWFLMWFSVWRIRNLFLKNYWLPWNVYGLTMEFKSALVALMSTSWMTLRNSQSLCSQYQNLWIINELGFERLVCLPIAFWMTWTDWGQRTTNLQSKTFFELELRPRESWRFISPSRISTSSCSMSEVKGQNGRSGSTASKMWLPSSFVLPCLSTIRYVVKMNQHIYIMWVL